MVTHCVANRLRLTARHRKFCLTRVSESRCALPIFFYTVQRYNIFLDFASVYLISFFSLTFFIIHKVYYTISNYPEIFLYLEKIISITKEIFGGS